MIITSFFLSSISSAINQSIILIAIFSCCRLSAMTFQANITLLFLWKEMKGKHSRVEAWVYFQIPMQHISHFCFPWFYSNGNVIRILRHIAMRSLTVSWHSPINNNKPSPPATRWPLLTHLIKNNKTPTLDMEGIIRMKKEGSVRDRRE